MVRLALGIGIGVLAGACATSGGVPRPFPSPDSHRPPPAPATAGTVADGYSISGTALALRGVPYRDGGADPAGFDCSGLVYYVFAQHGVAVPRDARRQFEVGERVRPSSLEPGDLVFFTTVAPGASHVGIAVGGDQFVHAPSDNGVVRVDRLSAQYWSRRFIGAKRIN